MEEDEQRKGQSLDQNPVDRLEEGGLGDVGLDLGKEHFK